MTSPEPSAGGPHHSIPSVGGTGVVANTALLVTYTFCETIVIFLFTITMARYLGAGEFGRIGFALSYALLTSILSDPGISTGVMKLVARSSGSRQADYVSNGLGLRLALTGYVFLASLIPFAFSSYMRESALLLLCILISEHLRNFALYFCFMFRAHQQTRYEVIALSVERVGSWLIGWYLLHQGHGALAIGIVYLTTRGASLLTAVGIYFTRFYRPSVKLDPKVTRDIKQQFYPLSLAVLSDRYNVYLPPVLLAFLSTEYATGIFQAAFKAVMPALMLCAAVAGSIYPAMAARFVSSPAAAIRIYATALRTMLHVLLPGAAVALVLPREVIVVLYGNGFTPAGEVLQWLVPYFLAMAVVMTSGLYLAAIDKQSYASAAAFSSVVLHLALGILFVRRWNAMGAAAALTVTQVFFAVVYLFLTHRFGRLQLQLPQWGSDILAFLISLAAVLPVRWLKVDVPLAPVVLGSLASFSAYGATLLLLNALSEHERKLLQRLKAFFSPELAYPPQKLENEH